MKSNKPVIWQDTKDRWICQVRGGYGAVGKSPSEAYRNWDKLRPKCRMCSCGLPHMCQFNGKLQGIA